MSASESLSPYAYTYVAKTGPGDARPTALQVLKDNNAIGNWVGRVILVTGGTSGIGTETARAFHQAGADVYFTARDEKKGAATIEDIRQTSSGAGKLEAIPMDMDSLESVKSAAGTFLQSSGGKLNVLINNAGIMGTPQSTTKDGFERQFGVNHLAHYVLTALLLPALAATSTPTFNSRVVAVSSSAHRFSPVVFTDPNLSAPGTYEPYRAYGQSKTANIWHANYIDRVFGAAHGVHALAVHPGAIWSGLYAHADQAMLDAWAGDAGLMAKMQSPAQGAATTVWAAAGKVWEGKGGKYLAECQVAGPAESMTALIDPGVAEHAYDPEGEDRLWELSGELTGVRVRL
ncbi:putative short-chain dehydrogenase [Lasiosphaeris hirsuta]|uniref:Short-chain dehydrogenase n=1 Tax=Lasiosphaeris hirsuta TaxID=260670 RepID=A0AA40AA68_9PEZI|nr:putative short-chain dehydrogenase [Lasiosphaeris hirsuta]